MNEKCYYIIVNQYNTRLLWDGTIIFLINSNKKFGRIINNPYLCGVIEFTMLLLLDPKMKNLYEVLFSKGSILDGYYNAMSNINNLKKQPFSIGIREKGTGAEFVSVLDELYSQVEDEFTAYSDNLNDLMSRRLQSFEEGATVVSYLVEGLSILVRGARLLNVINIKYHYTSSKSKVNEEYYEMLRIYFTSDKGKKIRCVNKNMGNSGQGPEKLAEKILRMLDYFDIQISGFSDVDMTAQKGHRHYDVELKFNNRKELIEIFSLVSLWGVYKKIYE